MNAVEFFKEWGYDHSKKYVALAISEDDISPWEIDLKKLVDSWELVEKVGGLSMARDFYKKFECVHVGMNLIQSRNLGKAIADVESVGGGV